MKSLLKELSETAGSLVKAIAAVTLTFNIVVFALGGADFAVISIAGTAIGLTAILIQLSRRLQRSLLTEIRNSHNQTQSFASLVGWLKPRRALPAFPLFGSTVLPDLALELAGLIHTRRPSVIVELGSGASTIILGYSAQLMGATVMSIEHHEFYAAKTSRMVEEHGLNDVVSVLHAPLTHIELDGRTWQWYSTDSLRQIDRIDMLFVDGPPGYVQPMSRYPALPVLLEKLSRDFFAILDDVVREEERRILQEWQTRIPNLVVEPLEVEKRAVLISFSGDSQRLHERIEPIHTQKPI